MLIGLHPQGSWSWRARPASLQNPLRASAETHRLHTELKSGRPCGQLPPHPSRSLKCTSNDLIIPRPTLACEQTLQGGVTLPQNFSRFLSSGPLFVLRGFSASPLPTRSAVRGPTQRPASFWTLVPCGLDPASLCAPALRL